MNLQELNEWIKSAKYVDTDNEETDSCTNHYCSRIYEKDGQFWQVDYCNEYPSEKWGEKGYIRGVYEPQPVRKASWVEYRHCWVSDKKP